jgi:hypothetical protein
LFAENFVVAVSKRSDARGADETLWRCFELVQQAYHLAGGLCSALPNRLLGLSVPTPIGDSDPSEMDPSVEVLNVGLAEGAFGPVG